MTLHTDMLLRSVLILGKTVIALKLQIYNRALLVTKSSYNHLL